MQGLTSLKDSLKQFDLEAIRARASSLSSTARTESESNEYRCEKCRDEEVILIRRENGENMQSIVRAKGAPTGTNDEIQ